MLLSADVVLIDARRDHYNDARPHSSIGNLTPIEFIAACRRRLPTEDQKERILQF